MIFERVMEAICYGRNKITRKFVLLKIIWNLVRGGLISSRNLCELEYAD
jgi:hypothetical protein